MAASNRTQTPRPESKAITPGFEGPIGVPVGEATTTKAKPTAKPKSKAPAKPKAKPAAKAASAVRRAATPVAIEKRSASFADRLNCVHFSQAVGDTLSE